MSTRVFLIDFENVHDSGLHGIKQLAATDYVYLLYTEHCTKLDMDAIQGIDARLIVRKVTAGHQSLDMHLATFLGYLIGTETDAETRYIIISNDTDFYNVERFWCASFDNPLKVIRQATIEKSMHLQSDGNSNDIDPEKWDYVANEILRIIRTKGKVEADGNHRITLASLSSRLHQNPVFVDWKKSMGLRTKTLIKRHFTSILTLIPGYPDSWIFDVPNLKKPKEVEIDEVSDPMPLQEEVPSPKDTDTQANENTLQDLPQLIEERLKQGGMNPDDALSVSNAIAQMLSQGKRAIYPFMLSEYGRTHGLELYRIVRQSLKDLDVTDNCFAA